jgi:prophage antirepressor-like protein
MMNSPQIIKSVRFNETRLDCYKSENDEFCATREQIGRMLGYTDPAKAIANIHDRNEERLDKFSGTLNLRTPGGIQRATVYSFKGLLEICRHSNQPKADAVMDFLWEVADEIRKTGRYGAPQKREKTLINPDLMAEIASGLGILSAKLSQALERTAPEPPEIPEDAEPIFPDPDPNPAPERETEPRGDSGGENDDTLPELEALSTLARAEAGKKEGEAPAEELYAPEEAARIAGLGKTAAQKALKDLGLIYRPSPWCPYRPTGRALADRFLKLRPYERVRGEVYGYTLTRKGVDLLIMSVPY